MQKIKKEKSKKNRFSKKQINTIIDISSKPNSDEDLYDYLKSINKFYSK